MNNLEKIKQICDGIPYTRDVPEEAKQIAFDNNIIIIVGGSDDLMYCYGAESYMTDYCEHPEGWDGSDLTKASDEQLKIEAEQLGLKIFWCGWIEESCEKMENYSVDDSGSFSYTVNDNIESLDFKVIEDDDDVYCTGKIIQLPEDFISALDN